MQKNVPYVELFWSIDAASRTPSQVLVKAGMGGLTKDSVAMAEQVGAISKKRLSKFLGRLSPELMSEVAVTLKIAMDLP
jgi:mRNA interferase MazF